MTIIGKVEYLADIDGRRLPAEARKHGRTIGREMGKGATDAFDGEFDADKRIEVASKKISKALDFQSSSWRNLSANTRQWILISSAVAAAGTDIAVLGSAAGAGITVLGSAFSSLAIGLGTTIAVFRDLNGELEDLEPAVRPAAEAFQSLGKSFETLRKRIQVAALDDAADAFKSLESTVSELGPAFDVVGESVGSLIKSFAKGIAPGTRNFENLNRLIKVSGPIFERLAKNAGTFGEALLEAFSSPEMTRSVNQLIDWLDQIAEGFLNFTRSDELGVWLRRAETVFASLGQLLGATGQLLNDLVDDAAVARLVGFLDNLTRFMPHLENLLSIIGELDIFGLIAQALADFGEALEPLAGPMEDLFDALNNIVSIAIDQWAKDLGAFADVLAPLAQGIADFLAEADEQVIRDVASAIGALAAAAALLVIGGKLAALASGLGSLARSFATLEKIDTKKIGKGLIAGLFAGLLLSFDSEAQTTQDKLSEGLSAVFVGAILGMKAGPIGALIGAAVAAIVTRISQEWDLLTSEIDWNPFDGGGLDWAAFGEQFAAELPAFFEAFAPSWVNGWNQLITIFDTLRTAVNDFVFGLGDALANGWNQIIVGVTAFGALLVATWNTMWTAVGTFLSTKWQEFLATITAVGGTIAAWISAWAGRVAAGWNTFWGGLGSIVSSTWATVSGIVTGALNAIASFIRGKIGEIGGIWNAGWNAISGAWSSFWGGITGVVSGAVSSIRGWISGLIGFINSAISSLQSLFGMAARAPSPGSSGGGGGGMAAGGIAGFQQMRKIGEAGREAVVPLQRPLAQIDPSVRAIAAFAQGKLGSAAAGGAGKTIIFREGAVVVQTISPDGRLIAESVVDRIAADAEL